MPRRSETVEHIVETMKTFGPVVAKSMFGGWGLYRDGVFFALVLGEVLYFKVDDGNRAVFEAAGLEPCVYGIKDGKKLVMSYRRAPDEALESPLEMAKWARLGFEAALRAAAKKAGSKRAR